MYVENTVSTIDSKVSKNANNQESIRSSTKPIWINNLYLNVNVRVTKHLFSKLEKNKDC